MKFRIRKILNKNESTLKVFHIDLKTKITMPQLKEYRLLALYILWLLLKFLTKLL